MSAVSKDVGAQVWQWSCWGGPNQVWTPKPQGSGVALVSANSNLCLDVAGISYAVGGQVWQWGCLGSANQTFIGPTSSAGTGGQTSGGSTTGGTPTAASTAPISLESASMPGFYVRRMFGELTASAPVSNPVDQQEASFKIVSGLSGQGISFQSTRETNRYLRQSNFNLYNNPVSIIGTSPDASFNRRASLAQTCGCNSGACVSYESVNFPGLYIHTRADTTLGIDAFTDTPAYRQQASFCERPSLDPNAR